MCISQFSARVYLHNSDGRCRSTLCKAATFSLPCMRRRDQRCFLKRWTVALLRTCLIKPLFTHLTRPRPLVVQELLQLLSCGCGWRTHSVQTPQIASLLSYVVHLLTHILRKAKDLTRDSSVCKFSSPKLVNYVFH